MLTTSREIDKQMGEHGTRGKFCVKLTRNNNEQSGYDMMLLDDWLHQTDGCEIVFTFGMSF